MPLRKIEHKLSKNDSDLSDNGVKMYNSGVYNKWHWWIAKKKEVVMSWLLWLLANGQGVE